MRSSTNAALLNLDSNSNPSRPCSGWDRTLLTSLLIWRSRRLSPVLCTAGRFAEMATSVCPVQRTLHTTPRMPRDADSPHWGSAGQQGPPITGEGVRVSSRLPRAAPPSSGLAQDPDKAAGTCASVEAWRE